MAKRPSVNAAKTAPQMAYNVAFVAGGRSATFDSIEHAGQNSAVLNFSSLSATDNVGTPVSAAYLGLEFDAQL